MSFFSTDDLAEMERSLGDFLSDADPVNALESLIASARALKHFEDAKQKRVGLLLKVLVKGGLLSNDIEEELENAAVILRRLHGGFSELDNLASQPSASQDRKEILLKGIKNDLKALNTLRHKIKTLWEHERNLARDFHHGLNLNEAHLGGVILHCVDVARKKQKKDPFFPKFDVTLITDLQTPIGHLRSLGTLEAIEERLNLAISILFHDWHELDEIFSSLLNATQNREEAYRYLLQQLHRLFEEIATHRRDALQAIQEIVAALDSDSKLLNHDGRQLGRFLKYLQYQLAYIQDSKTRSAHAGYAAQAKAKWS